MITLHDLETAIAKCQGESNPNASTCIKLAAYYTIKQAMFGDQQEIADDIPDYSYAQAPAEYSENTIYYDSGTEFSRAIDGKYQDDILDIIDELMTVLQATNPRLYSGVMRKIENL